MELVGDIMIAVLVTLVFLSAIVLVVWAIARRYDYFEHEPFTKAIKKILHVLAVVDCITVFLVIGFLVVAPLWVNIFS